MAGPWEKYQQQEAPADVPWAKYARPEPAVPAQTGGIEPTIEPDPNMKYVNPKTGFSRIIQDATQALTKGGRWAQESILQGALGGASDELLGTMRHVLLGEPLQESVSRYKESLDRIPPAARIPGEILGGMMTMSAAPAGALARLPNAALYGGSYGYAAGEGDIRERAKTAGIGAAGSVAGTLAMSGLSRLVNPRSTPEVQTLMREGVTPTPGQVLGGVARNTEEKLSSVPFLGSAIRMGESRAMNQFNVGAINRALRPAGVGLPKGTKAGADAMIAAQRIISDGYDDVFRGVSVSLDKQFGNDIANVARRAATELNDAGRKTVQQEIAKFTTLPEMKGNTIAGRTAKEVLSALRGRARQFQQASDPYTQDVGRVIGDMAESFNSLLKRALPAEKATKYTGLDKAFKEMLRVTNAASRVGGDVGTFTPAQLGAAARQMDQSLRKGATARGQAVGQEFAEAGRQVLGSTVPNSGTFDRAALTGALLGGAYIDPILGAGMASPAMAYTPIGQHIAASLLAGRQGPSYQAAAQGIRSLAPYAAAAGAPAAVNLSKRR